MSELTNRIELLLSENKMRCSDLARGAGISDTTIRSWFNRNSIPSVEAAYKVAQYFRVTVEWLVTGQNTKFDLTKDERELVEIFRCLDERDQLTIITIERTLCAQYCATDESRDISG